MRVELKLVAHSEGNYTAIVELEEAYRIWEEWEGWHQNPARDDNDLLSVEGQVDDQTQDTTKFTVLTSSIESVVITERAYLK